MIDFMEEDPELEMLGLKRQAQGALEQFRMAEMRQDVEQMVRERLEKLSKELEDLDGSKGSKGTKKSVTPESRNPQQAAGMAQGGADPALIQQLLAQRMQGM